MVRRLLTFLLASLTSVAAAAPADAPQETRRIFEDFGTPGAGNLDPAGGLWLSLWEPHVRFVLPAQRPEKLEELSHVLRRTRGGPGLKLRYDAAAGLVNAQTGTIDYPMCGVLIEDVAFEPQRPCDDGPAAPPATPEAALVRARAHTSVGNFRVAQALLAPLSFSQPAHHKLLLRVRSETALALAQLEQRLSPEADRLLAAALADLRAVEQLEPDDLEIQFSLGSMLEQLGGYAEARTIYENILRRWPDEELRVAVRLGALRREQGDYEAALAPLNELASRGPQQGMRYHYHRGWTLSLLGRLDEAVAEYSEGLETQPDYSSAYLRRACARAGLGQFDAALRDAEEAIRLVAQLPDAASSPLARDELREAEDTRGRIEAAAASGAQGGQGFCNGPYWRRHESPRPRSPLLPLG